MREEVDLLKDHADLGPEPAELVAAAADIGSLEAMAEYDLAFNFHRPGIGGPEQVHCAKKRALATAARTDDHDRLTGSDLKRDPLQNVHSAETLVDVREPDHRLLLLHHVPLQVRVHQSLRPAAGNGALASHCRKPAANRGQHR
jgi:hypothetical protein